MKKLITTAALITISLCAFAQESQIRDAMQKKYGDPNAKKGTDWVNNQMLNATYAAAYNFPLSMSIHITTYKNGQKDKESDVKYYINSSEKNFAFNTGDMNSKKSNSEMLMIYDNTNNTMIMLDQKNKTGTTININAFMSKQAATAKKQNGEGADKKSNMQCNKTGKTKMINGYSCEEYVCVDNDRNTKTEAWITNKLSVDIAQSGSKGPMAGFSRSIGNLGGMMMQAFMYENNVLKTSMEVTDVNEKADMTVKTGDYKMNQH